MKKKLQKIIQDAIVQEESYVMEHNEVLEILKPLNGMALNGRTLNQKRLGEKFRFVYQYGMFHIEGKNSHLIGYDSTPTIDVEKFKEWDACNGSAALNRIEQLKNINVETAAKVFGAIEKHYELLKFLFGELEREKLGSYHFPAYYDVLRAIQGGDSDKYVKLNDFYYLRK
jgi:hypothetical protein